MSKLTPFKKFNTANGFCYLLDNYVVITDHSDPKEILRRKDSDKIGIIRVTSLVLFLSLLAFSYYNFLNGDLQNVYILLPSMFFLIVYFFRLRNRSMTNIIARNTIQGVELKKHLFNPAFFIHFKNNKGKLVTRIIVMKSNNQEDIRTAKTLLIQHNLIKNSNTKQESKNTPQETLQTQKKSVEKNNQDEYKKTQPQETYKRNSDGYLKDY